MKNNLFFVLAVLLLSTQLYATHNKSGEITYRQLNSHTIEGVITTYTESISTNADRDSLLISWGDGVYERLVRSNGPDNDQDGIPDGENIGNGVKVNIYRGVHVYADFGNYVLAMEDPNRNAGILNVNFPNSVSIPFYVETEIELSAELNSSPILLNPPIDIAYVGQVFMHTPNAFDVEDDSITYRLITPMGGDGQDVPNYVFPEIINANTNSFTLNAATGLIIWDSPEVIGSYVLAIEITSYRNGEMVDRMVRDMQITVEEEDNIIPELTSLSTYSQVSINEVSVGEIVDIEVATTELDEFQTIQLSSNSGLYDYFSVPALFTITTSNDNLATAVFNWEVTAEHIRSQPLQLVIKSTDNLGLTNFLVYRFRVMGITNTNDLIADRTKMELYPNPVASTLMVTVADGIRLDVFAIYNQAAQLIKTNTFSARNEIDASTLPAGLYYLSVGNGILKPFLKL